MIAAFSSSSKLSEFMLPMNETAHGMADGKLLMSE